MSYENLVEMFLIRHPLLPTLLILIIYKDSKLKLQFTTVYTQNKMKNIKPNLIPRFKI